MLFCSDYIVPKKRWQPFVDLFRHGIGESIDGLHFKGIIEVRFPRTNHLFKRDITVNCFFDNEQVERRPSLVFFGSFESSKGKSFLGRWIMGWWSH
jgi:hypothetical protein